jgi:ribose transport system ATP-binding protein
MVELVKALAIEEFIDHPVIILFDEPTSVLAPGEIKILFRQIERLRSRSSIVFVSHRLDEVLSICDRILVMADGRKVAEKASAATEREELYHLMVGRRHVETHRANAETRRTEENARLQVRNLSVHQHFRDISLDLRNGEIVGLAGVLGSGAEELCRAIFGAEQIVGGAITLDGNKINPRNPADSIRRGVGYLPADRKSEGMLRGRSLVQNMVLTYGLEYGYLGVLINRRRETREAVSWMRRLHVKMQSPNEPIDRLSGGNQQKVILGKWLLSKSLQVLLLDHPTRGLDPGARDDVFDAMREAAKAGLAIIFVGDTVDEILELADRILVMKDGKITARFDLTAGENPSQEDVLMAMI